MGFRKLLVVLAGALWGATAFAAQEAVDIPGDGVTLHGALIGPRARPVPGGRGAA